MADSARGPLRSELLAGLSLAIDLGLGQPMDHMLRSSILAQRIAAELHLDTDTRERIFHSTVLAWIGCHADSFELAHLFGDDIDFRAATYTIDNRGLPLAGLMLGHSGAGQPALQQAGAKARFLVNGRSSVQNLIASHCHSAATLAGALGMDPQMADILICTFERWDGKGLPEARSAAEIPLEMRVTQLADVAEIFLRTGGLESAVEMVRRRRGTQFDPALADLFCDRAHDLTDGLMATDPWTDALASAPPGPPLAGVELDAVLAAMGDFADLKSPYTSGHSRGVAELADAAAGAAGLSTAARDAVRRAGWVHDLGRMGVSNSVWDKTGSLTDAELERAHMHPFLSERILGRIPGCRRLSAVAGAHHERLDGSGYPRGVGGEALDAEQRILAAADAFHSWLEPRPHREAVPETDAVARLQHEAAAGRLDGDAVDAVLVAAGVRNHRRTARPTGLTDRETEVLRLLCRGLGSRGIAELLVISPKTVRNHIEHIYEKIGVTNRVGATLFAQRNGLLELPVRG
ncbi:HD domain-containing phosphohydrolase [Glaciibacter sp. 2TAF33]|uniref:HD domain-containing phosphohydrolase n=1 Tax=Glaciibacter sp. 2TAF33 TaxID=3233015 RepID=UPI003F922E03